MFPHSFDRLVIENIHPNVDNGKYPVKFEVGDIVNVTADVFKDGHEILTVLLKYKNIKEENWMEVEMLHNCNDEWHGSFELRENTRYLYTIEAYAEKFLTWRDELEKKSKETSCLKSELIEGTQIIRNSINIANEHDKEILSDLLVKIQKYADMDQLEDAIMFALAEELKTIMLRNPDRSESTMYAQNLVITADRVQARYASWYEIFPRSQGKISSVSGTFRDCIERLPDIQKMGFDVLYLTPIHPIGFTNRKGPNNSLVCNETDPGVPYAIGNHLGGHKAIEPSLGTFEDFNDLVVSAKQHGMEIAMDFAINCSPDHPYVSEHPDWFYKRPDGTIKFAENPPKKYEDIYPLNFYCKDMVGLWNEMLSIILFWADRGVKIFRVDNPHTKPVAFWEFLITKTQEIYPETIFLSEAFTKPKMMKALAKVGFTQSYTYFTWRNFKQELIEYFTELTTYPMNAYFRGNLFTNTPDILPTILKEGGRPAFMLRLILAATLSSVYGIYSGYELCDNDGIPCKEEYNNSEKYEIKTIDWDKPGNIKQFVSSINHIRKSNRSLQHYNNLKFYNSENQNILFYGKSDIEQENNILVVVNLDPFQKHESFVYVPIEQYGILPNETYQVDDLLNNSKYLWRGSKNFISLDPKAKVAHIFLIRKFGQKENEFDYFQ